MTAPPVQQPCQGEELRRRHRQRKQFLGWRGKAAKKGTRGLFRARLAALSKLPQEIVDQLSCSVLPEGTNLPMAS
jgi:hypothetical protein